MCGINKFVRNEQRSTFLYMMGEINWFYNWEGIMICDEETDTAAEAFHQQIIQVNGDLRNILRINRPILMKIIIRNHVMNSMTRICSHYIHQITCLMKIHHTYTHTMLYSRKSDHAQSIDRHLFRLMIENFTLLTREEELIHDYLSRLTATRFPERHYRLHILRNNNYQQ